MILSFHENIGFHVNDREEINIFCLWKHLQSEGKLLAENRWKFHAVLTLSTCSEKIYENELHELFVHNVIKSRLRSRSSISNQGLCIPENLRAIPVVIRDIV